jgi:hypothetical protein
MTKEFFDALFYHGEATCFARSYRDTGVTPVTSFASRDYMFFAINPLRLANADNTQNLGRSDKNVIAYRSFLIEMDKVGLDQQRQIIEEALGGNYTSIVYSGNKSLHTIVTLSEDLKSAHEYRAFAMALYGLFNGLADEANKNPSRFSRFPQALRADTGKIQELIDLKARVPIKNLSSILEKRGIPIVLEQPKRTSKPNQHVESALVGLPPLSNWVLMLSPRNRLFLECGTDKGQWNNSLYKAAVEAAQRGIPKDYLSLKVMSINGYLDDNDRRTIDSAFRKFE